MLDQLREYIRNVLGMAPGEEVSGSTFMLIVAAFLLMLLLIAGLFLP